MQYNILDSSKMKKNGDRGNKMQINNHDKSQVYFNGNLQKDYGQLGSTIGKIAKLPPEEEAKLEKYSQRNAHNHFVITIIRPVLEVFTGDGGRVIDDHLNNFKKRVIRGQKGHKTATWTADGLDIIG